MQQKSLIKLIFCVCIGVGIWYVSPIALAEPAPLILAVFAAVLASFFLHPYPMGMSVLIALVILSSADLIGFKDILHGFASRVVWLVIAAFMIAKAVIESQLGTRIALNLIRFFSTSPIGIAYAICISELFLSPIIASNTARGGGILSPIVRTVIHSIESQGMQQDSNIKKYLILTASHANVITSAMFLTAMAANPLISHYAKQYLEVEFDWLTWSYGAILPGLVSLIGLPLLLKLLVRPEKIDAKVIQDKSKQELRQLGQMTSAEKIVSLVFICLILLWATASFHHLETVQVAWFGVLALLLTGVLTWEGVVRNSAAWDTMIWLGGLLTIVSMLEDSHVTSYFINHIQLSWLGQQTILFALLFLALIYFLSMYACSMLTAHISALLGGFYVLCNQLEAPPLLAAALFAYASNLCACLTHYSTGPVVIYYAYHFVSIPQWFIVGATLGLYHMIVWLGIGLPWWHYLGWW